MLFGSLFCITKHLLKSNTTILHVFAIIPIGNNFFIRLASFRTSTIDVIFSKVEENSILPFFIHTMRLANFTFYIVLEFFKHLKLYLFLNTCLVAPKSKYQQSTIFLLLLVLIGQYFFNKIHIFFKTFFLTSYSRTFIIYSNCNASFPFI